MRHRSFRPSDFAWSDLPTRLAGLTTGPAVYVLKAAGCWTEADHSADRPGRSWRWRVGLAVGLAAALLAGYPLAAGPAAYLDGAGLTSGQLLPLYEPLLRNRDRAPIRHWMSYVRWCEEQGRRAALD